MHATVAGFLSRRPCCCGSSISCLSKLRVWRAGVVSSAAASYSLSAAGECCLRESRHYHHTAGSATAASSADGASRTAEATPPPSCSSPPLPPKFPPFQYRSRWRYAAPFRSTTFTSYVKCRERRHAVSIAQTYLHPETEVRVTLVPLRHLAHPSFFAQVDSLCCQHQSVLMEGRTGLTGAPYSTLVPPREPLPLNARPPDMDDDEGWEPREEECFFQPFSWGVIGSPEMTVIHAADHYDYERLPWYASVRFSTPLIGSLAREKCCLNMIPHLFESGYRSFAIPWGAAHMPIFHEMLLDNGFEPFGMCSLLMFNQIDGERSEGELLRMLTYERRLQRRSYLLYGLAGLAVLWGLSRFCEVEWSHRRYEKYYSQAPPRPPSSSVEDPQ